MPFDSVSMGDLDRAFHQARLDLAAVGLLQEGRYLDRIDCYLTVLPAWGNELGYVYDGGVGPLFSMLGFEPGVIYIPRNAKHELHIPGNTLLDTVRHEFAHAWAWLDPAFVHRPWFRGAFGARYQDEWDEAPAFDDQSFVSAYATVKPKEDFAETFMAYLKYRRSLTRFERRPGLRRKIRAVERAVRQAARERVPRIRGPRA